ncbi:MAG TPA: hypothetical protein VJU77_10030 [Chthoniobacterales bacterium]|nr:hypothetical protein [Chthoniobacterales bacterium]
MKRFLLILLIALALPSFAPAATLDETARFLAGIRTQGDRSSLEPLTHDPAWQDHARTLDGAWVKKDFFQIRPIRAWMLANAPEPYSSTKPVYYMFGGPDFLYANLFYPQAKTYILAGLEPVGTVPDLNKMDIAALRTDLNALRASMHTVLQTHYFITKDMRADLTRPNLGGTLPILYVFLARLNCTVLSTTYVKSPAEGVKITFTTRGGSPQTLYYFKTDLSGGPSPFLKWCAEQGPGNSLLKAASYLMHTEGFSGVRNFLLEHSRVIIQDDTGLPLKAFPKSWKVDFYGRYVPHAEMFGKYHQPDLAAIYNREPPPPELGFAFGYHWQRDRGILMLATHK